MRGIHSAHLPRCRGKGCALAAREAQARQPAQQPAQLEVQRGLLAFGGATIRMVERAGWGHAMRWLLTGDEFDGETALRLGFVQELVDEGQGRTRALALAQRIAEQAPLAVRASRRSAQLAAEHGQAAAIAAFPEQLAAVAASEDFAEGVRSFLERRAGRYSGR